MKYLNAVMILLFVVAAAVQYNDSDPMLWIAIYGAAAFLCVLFAIGKFPTMLASVFSTCCLVGSLVLGWQLLTTDPVYPEEVFNEAAGLFVVFLWIFTMAWTRVRERSSIT